MKTKEVEVKKATRMKMMLAVLVSIAGWTGAAIVEKPVLMPEAMVSMTVSDLQGFIDGVGGVSAQVSPMASGMMIKSMLGMQLGDPGLMGIAPGKGLAIVATDETNVFAVIEVSGPQAASYATTLAQKGVQSKYTNGVLVVASAPSMVEKGISLISSVKENLLAVRSPTLRIATKPSEFCAKNKEQIDGMMQRMPMMMGMGMLQSPGMDPAYMQGAIKLLEGELRFLLSLARQSATYEVVLAPLNGSLRINETLVPQPGSRLAALVNAPSINNPNPKIQAGLLGDATLALDFSLANPDALNTYLEGELGALMQEMGIESEQLAKLNETMKKWMGLYCGSGSEAVDFGGGSFMNIKYALQVDDEAKVLEVLKNMNQDMAPFLDLYKSMGMPMSMEFKENAREYKNVKIHQMKVHVAMPENQQSELQAMNINMSNMVYDVAVTEGILVYAMGDTKIETLIDRIKDESFTAAPLKARNVYPAGGSFYCDFDVAKYMAGISSIMPKDPNNPLPKISSMMQGADPITAAGFSEDGMVMWSINVPGTLLAKIGQATMTMQMQKMQQGAPGMAPMNAPTATPTETPAGMPTEETPVPAP